MPTCRQLITEAFRTLKGIATGDDPTVDELAIGLEAVGDLILDLHEGRGPMRDVDLPLPIANGTPLTLTTSAQTTSGASVVPVLSTTGVSIGDAVSMPGYFLSFPAVTAIGVSPPSITLSTAAVQLVPSGLEFTDIPAASLSYVANENQRCRIQAGFNMTVTLPNSVPLFDAPDPYDYGFAAPLQAPLAGSTAPADGSSFRQPRDGARIEVVGTTQGLWFYRADINQWMVGIGLTLDSEMPFNARYASAMGALVAERIMESLPEFDEPSPGLMRRIQSGRTAMLLRIGTARDPVRAEYF